MAVLQFRGFTHTGVTQFDTGISQLMALDNNGSPILVSVSGSNGGLVSFTLTEGGLPSEMDHRFLTFNTVTGLGPTVTTIDTNGNGLELLIGGIGNGGIEAFGLNGSGDIGNGHDISGINGGSGSKPLALQVGSDVLVTASLDGSGFVTYRLNPNGSVSGRAFTGDSTQSHAREIGALATASINGVDILLTASTSEYGISAYVMSGTGATLGTSVGPQDGLGIMVPTDMEVVVISGKTFVILASAPAGYGTSGALTVLSINKFGVLKPTDHVLDTQATRFGQIQAIATETVNGRTYVVAAGGDGGLSLFTLTPDGKLVHLESFIGTTTAGLAKITSLQLIRVGGELQVFASTEGDVGVGVFSISLGQQGLVLKAAGGGAVLAGQGGNDILNGRQGDDTLNGSGGDDLLLDGGGSDSLRGGAGADLFVMSADGQVDTIQDFRPSEDRINLADWPMLYDAAALNITATNYGARVTWGNEVLIVRSATGQSLTQGAVRAAIVIDVNRTFQPPSVTLFGTNGDDLLEGTWGADFLMGGKGDDTLIGGKGDDDINGGMGRDTVEIAVSIDDMIIHDLGNGVVKITTAFGTDTIRNVEVFKFLDQTVSLADLLLLDEDLKVGVVNGTGNGEMLKGSDNADLIHGYGGNDQLYGGKGYDEIWGDYGRDYIIGGKGKDLLLGRQDNDTLLGGPGRDTLRGGDGNDTLQGGIHRDALFGGAGADFLRGQGGWDRLDGGDGNDKISGGAGSDRLAGGKGSDHLLGGTGDDRMIGGAGKDILLGGDGSDTFVFVKGAGEDRVRDFNWDQDRLEIDSSYFAGINNAAQLISTYAHLTKQGVVFDFGGGDVLILESRHTLSGLSDLIDIL